MAYQSVQGRDLREGVNVNGLCFFIFLFFIFSSFFSAARGQTVGPILTSDTSKCVFLNQSINQSINVMTNAVRCNTIFCD